MSVKIRLMRMGKKKQPTYRVVVADGRSPRDGRYIEILGQYRPREEPSYFAVDDEKVLGWLHQGAQPTDQVHRLLVSAGIWERYETERRASRVRCAPRRRRRRAPRPRRPTRDAAAKAAAEAEAKAAATEAAASGGGRRPRTRAAERKRPTEAPRPTRRTSERRRRVTPTSDFDDEVARRGQPDRRWSREGRRRARDARHRREPDAVEVELVERRDEVTLLVHADPTTWAGSSASAAA